VSPIDTPVVKTEVTDGNVPVIFRKFEVKEAPLGVLNVATFTPLLAIPIELAPVLYNPVFVSLPKE
jgi:hypothetical protein